MDHIATPFNHAGAYRGMSCSCGLFTSSTGIREHDEKNCLRHTATMTATDIASRLNEQQETIKMLLDRLNDRTQGMLARQVKLMDRIRKLEREKRDWQDARLAGRHEALHIILGERAETFTDDHQISREVGDTGEWSSEWNEESLSALLDVSSRNSVIEHLDGQFYEMAYENITLKDQIESLEAKLNPTKDQ